METVLAQMTSSMMKLKISASHVMNHAKLVLEAVKKNALHAILPLKLSLAFKMASVSLFADLDT